MQENESLFLKNGVDGFLRWGYWGEYSELMMFYVKINIPCLKVIYGGKGGSEYHQIIFNEQEKGFAAYLSTISIPFDLGGVTSVSQICQ